MQLQRKIQENNSLRFFFQNYILFLNYDFSGKIDRFEFQFGKNILLQLYSLKLVGSEAFCFCI